MHVNCSKLMRRNSENKQKAKRILSKFTKPAAKIQKKKKQKLSAEEYKIQTDYFLHHCTRSEVLSQADQLKLFHYLKHRQSEEFMAPISSTSNNNSVKKKATVMNDSQEMLFMYRVLTQSVTASKYSNAAFSCTCYEAAADYCIASNDSKQLFVCLVKLVHEIYPLLRRKKKEYRQSLARCEEFVSYYILLLALVDQNSSTVIKKLHQSDPEVLQSMPVAVTMQLYQAIIMDNYFRFFAIVSRYYQIMPKYWLHLLTLLEGIDKMRLLALKMMSKSYYSVELSLIAKSLAFQTTRDAYNWIRKKVKTNVLTLVAFNEKSVTFKLMNGR